MGMRKYFQFKDYSGNMKARVAIFNLTGRASIWWEHFRQVKNINERKIVWKQFWNFLGISTSLIDTMMVRLKNSMS